MNLKLGFKIFFSFIFFVSLINISFSVTDSFKVLYPNYFNEQDNIYSPIHYLNEELLSIEFCSDKKSNNISLNLICDNGDNKEINLFQEKYLKNNPKSICYYSNFNLENSPCDNFKLELTYKNNNKIKKIQRDFIKQKQSKLINYVLSQEVNNLNPIDLSYYLIVNNNLETIYSKRSVDVYDKLKNERDNEDKCWPDSVCDINETTSILRNIKLAGYDSNSRLLDDGLIYLDNNQLNNENNPLEFKLNLEKDFNLTGVSNSSNATNIVYTSNSIECNLTIDGELRSYIFDTNSNMSFDKSLSSSLDLICNESLDKINFDIYNLNNNLMDSKTLYNEREFSYSTSSYACLGENSCNFKDTINSLIALDSKIDNFNLVENYLDSNIIINNNEKYLDVNNKFENMGKYLYFKQDNDLLDYLKFHQNNDGSWGEDSKYDRIIETSWSVLGLQKRDSNSENVKDGKKWIYYNEPTNGWGSVEKNTLAYLAIKEQIKPYLYLSSKNELKNITYFEILNPTIYNLKDIKLVFSPEINKYLSYTENLGDLEGEDSINFSVKLDENFYGTLTGLMTISGVDGKEKEITFLEIPISIQGPEPFEFETNSFKISEDNNEIIFKLKNKIGNFFSSCNYLNPFTNKKESLNLSDKNLKFVLKDKELKTGNFDLVLNCNLGTNNFKLPLNFNVNISKPSFIIEQKKVIVNSTEDFSINLESISDDKQTVSIEIVGFLSGIIKPTEDEKIIASKDNRDIYFTISNPNLDLFNGTNSTIIISSNSGYSKKIPIEIIMNPIKEKSSNIWIYIIIGVVVFIIIIFLIRRYRELNEINYQEQTSQNEDEIYFDDF